MLAAVHVELWQRDICLVLKIAKLSEFNKVYKWAQEIARELTLCGFGVKLD